MTMRIAVVIPSYRVRRRIGKVIEKIPASVGAIYVVDDKCPEESGAHVVATARDDRVRVIYHDTNEGVGGATLTGYRAALEAGYDIVVKLDGDGQMDPAEITRLVAPIMKKKADYVSGNRFHSLDLLLEMPRLRLFGNSIFSLVSKASSGYWNLMDPTNGYTAIHREALGRLPLEQIAKRFFFESDMLYQLYLVRAVVRQVPLKAIYRDEESNLRLSSAAITFPLSYLDRFTRRIFYSYFLRDFGVCSLQLAIGSLLMVFGAIFGAYHWRKSILTGLPATTGTVMLAATPVLLGFQLILQALLYDVTAIPKEPLVAEVDPEDAA